VLHGDGSYRIGEPREVNGMQCWEYKILDVAKPKTDVEDLNRMGADGWEAVAMVSTWGVSEMRFVHPIVLLKRPLPDDADSKPPT
jgi:hypothetical protein